MKIVDRKAALVGITFAIVILLGGCSNSVDSAVEVANDPPTTTDQNLPPSISGVPQTSITVGDSYAFAPVAADPDGDLLTFSISGKPPWADFDSSTGSLSGAPDPGDEGNYSGISISVSDGTASASLPLFSVAVNQFSTGSTTLSWTPPTQNNDGSPLLDLAGYKIYYGVSQGSYSNQVLIDNPGIATYMVDNLSPNTYYFVTTSFNAAGIESDFSNIAVLTIN